MFEKYIKSIYLPAFKESPNSVRKKLLTLLKTWYIYYPHDTLNTIYNTLELSKHESELLSPEDQMKIQKFIDGVRREESKNRQAPVPRQAVQPPMS